MSVGSGPRHFTLVELLVVMAVISILASLLLPALGRAMDSARFISCSSNLKSIGTSIQLYTNDHEGRLPPYCADAWNSAVVGGSGKGHLDPMWSTLEPYGLHGQVVQCPFKKSKSWKQYWMMGASSRSDFFYRMTLGSHYDQSTYKVLSVTDTKLGSHWDPTSIQSPSARTLVLDNATNPTPSSWGNNHVDSSGNFSASQTALFLDFHVELRHGPNISKCWGLGF